MRQIAGMDFPGDVTLELNLRATDRRECIPVRQIAGMDFPGIGTPGMNFRTMDQRSEEKHA